MRSTGRIYALLLVILTLPSLVLGSAGISPYEEMRERLFVNGRPIGQPLTSRQPDIRVVRVESVREADSLFFGLCLKCRVIRRIFRGEEWFACHLPPHYGGWLYYTHRPLRGWRVVGTVYVRSPLLNKWGFTEIRFVETVKLKKTK